MSPPSSTHTEDSSSASVYLSESSDNEGSSGSETKTAWYTVYEGRAKEVTVCNLTPGQTLQFRVRASSHRITPNGPRSNGHANAHQPLSWGPASHSTLKVTTPAVPPINSPSNLRLYGRPRPTEIRLKWDPPTSNGGAPILNYELWQSLCDPVSGSPIKTLPVKKQVEGDVVVSATSESLQDICKESTARKAGPLSAPSSVSSSPLHAARSKPTDSQLIYSGLEPVHEVTGLHSGQSFAFRVRARNSTGWSDWSEWSTFSTAPSPPGEPTTAPRVKPLSATSVAVSWEQVKESNGAEVTEYRVEWQPNVAEPSQTCTPPEVGDEVMLPLPAEVTTCRSRNPSTGSSKCLNDGFQLVRPLRIDYYFYVYLFSNSCSRILGSLGGCKSDCAF